MEGNVSIALDGSNIYFAYTLVSNDLELQVWPYDLSSQEIYEVDTSNEYGFDVSVAVDSDNVYLSCTDLNMTTLYFYKAAKLNLSSWSVKTVDSGGHYSRGWHNTIGIDGNNIYISYHTGYVNLARSNDGGDSWEIIQIDPSPEYSFYEADNFHSDLVVNGSNLYITYYYYGGIADEYLKLAKSIDGGDSWTKTTIHSDYMAGPYNSIAIQGPNIYASYFHAYSPGYKDLYFAKSIDGGDNW